MYSAFSFLSEFPILLYSFVGLIICLVGFSLLSERIHRVRGPRASQQAETSPPVVFAKRTDAPTRCLAVEQAYRTNRKNFYQANPKSIRLRYSPSDFDIAADQAKSVETTFGPDSHSVLYMAETHGASLFESMADNIERLGRVDLAEILRRGVGIADRALSPDADGDSEHPSYIALEADAIALQQNFDAQGGVSAYQAEVEGYLEKNYPWVS